MTNNTPKGYSVVSIISLVFSGIGMGCLCLMLLMILYAGSGSSSSAITNEFILGSIGVVLCVVCAWFFGIIGGIMGLVTLIVGLVKKYTERIWIPGVALGLGFFPFIGPIILLIAVSA